MSTRQKLIIFGAGASFGAGDAFFNWNDVETPKLPPLGMDLFSDLQKFNPDGWGSLPADIAESFRQDFEKGMEKLSKCNSFAMAPLQRAMAWYFFCFFPGQQNLYVRLAKIIKENRGWNGALVTLNYERLLEQSICYSGMRPICGKEKQESNEIEICFPHGCCHIFGSIRGTGISFSKGISTGGGNLSVISRPRDFIARIRSDSFPPVMSYFEPQKSTVSGADFILRQRDRFKELVCQADTIAIIGMRVRTHDSHMWSPLANADGQLIYCGGKEGGQEFGSWQFENRVGKDDIILHNYFAESFNDLCDYLEINNKG